ncbi:SigmaW regulon antibacterial [Symmachiella dynata]|uniref:SigmaW regulon antibacterial n=2 Tax=Symmachiella dynata TaxID=2527995 RepID=A0A517ZSB1_9PLAN|nr:SigmaW regulon antibacterial [Symmachiella dynata]
MIQLQMWTAVIAAPAQKMGEWLAVAFIGVMFLMVIVTGVFYFQIGSLWLQAFLARTHISLIQVVGMKLRRSPVKDIVRWKIMAAQAGVAISAKELEAAALQGADVERAVLAMIRAQETGQEMTWNDVIAEDTDQRLRDGS